MGQSAHLLKIKMINQLIISDLNGIATITRTGGDSQLSIGEYATFRPFEALMSSGYDLKMGIKVSNKQYDKAARNGWEMLDGNEIHVQDRKQRSNKILVNHSTLLKHINPMMFMSNSSQHTIEEVTGKKVNWKSGKPVYPNLTVEEDMWCCCADWAYNKFGTLKGVSVVVSLNNGVQLTKQF